MEIVPELKLDENDDSDEEDVPTMQDLAGEESKGNVPSMDDLIRQAQVADRKAIQANQMVR